MQDFVLNAKRMIIKIWKIKQMQRDKEIHIFKIFLLNIYTHKESLTPSVIELYNCQFNTANPSCMYQERCNMA